MYRTFYAIDLLHTYFSDLKSRGVRVVPTEDCVRTFQRHRLTFREVGNRTYILGWLDEESRPIVTIDPSVVFRFYLVATTPEFFQFTSLPFDPSAGEALYLSNLSDNSANGRLYLSMSNAAFAAASDYDLGDLAVSGTDVFECVRSHGGSGANVVTDGEHWQERGEVRAPDRADVLNFGSGVRTIELAAPVENVTVNVFGLNREDNTFTAAVLTETKQFAPAKSIAEIPLWKLPAGKYRVTANGQEKFFYHDPGLTPGSVIGVVEIFNHLEGDDAHALLDADGKAKGTIFSMVFLNPLARWKYIARTESVLNVRDQSGLYEFESGGPLVFQSKTLMPLTEKAYGEIVIDYEVGEAQTLYTKIKNPSPANLKRVTDGPDLLPCAEIYLNY
jgi:hypothetical protein